ncbi:MAG TPA: branched-chain-amino-acid transaminase [Candidatus Bathyarchaeia archaeon]|nr:branched-chain-amino-acid transaminase [Candidatus Bathyarchaeia archaeon]
MDKEPLIYIDGKYYPKSQAKISVFDHGLLYGDGVFEGIRAYNGVVFKLKEHVDRLYRSAHPMMLKIPLTKEQMIEVVLETLRKNNMRDAYIRLVVTRGVGDLGLDPRKCPKATVFIITGAIVLHGNEAKTKGITTLISWVRRNPVDSTSHEIKSLNYLNSVMAKIEANAAGADEAICLDKGGFVSEGVGENLFIVKNGKIFTPPVCSGALPGITAQVTARLAAQLGNEVTESNITPYQLFTADEAFFTGTAAEIVPIREVNKRQIGNGSPGPMTKRLITAFEKVVLDPSEGVPINP